MAKQAKKINSNANQKPKFDMTSFVFETDVAKIEAAIQRFEEQDADPMAEPFTKDELYWFGWWLLNLPEVKKRNLLTIPVCAVESAVLKLYSKPNKRKK